LLRDLGNRGERSRPEDRARRDGAHEGPFPVPVVPRRDCGVDFGHGEFRRRSIERLQKVPGSVFAPDCYCYRCPFGLTYPDCGVACAEYVDYQLTHEGDVAAMIL